MAENITNLPGVFEGRGAFLSRQLNGKKEANITIGRKEVRVDLESPIGAGDLSVIFPGKINNQVVAVKVFLPLSGIAETHDTQKLQEEFLREANLLERARHRGLPRYYGRGEINLSAATSLQAIVRESFPRTLEAKLQGRNSTKDAITMAKQLASALDYLREKHNTFVTDTDPSNIGIRRNGEYAFLDLGSAVSGGHGKVGTSERFSPPELARLQNEEKRLGNVGPKAQVYSLGALTYAMIGGNIPYKEEVAMGFDVKPLENTPEKVLNVLKKALRFDPNERYSTPGKFSQELEIALRS
ncbi:protein kinase [Candidatus Woesebacteria bacterium]|nr:protein kinase [Candidatus Woesebacteria bacterium]